MRGTQAPAPDQSPGPPRQFPGTWGHSPGFGGHGNPIWLRTAFYTQHEASTGSPRLSQRAALPQPACRASRRGFQARPAPLFIPAWALLTRGQERPSPAKPSTVQAREAPRRPWWTRGHCLFLCPGSGLRAGSTFGQPQNPVWTPLSSSAQRGAPAGVQGCSRPHRLCPFSVLKLSGAVLAGTPVPSSHWDPCFPPISCL